MAAEFFLNFLEQFNFWLWVMFWIIIFLTLLNNKGWKRVYFLVLIVGFLLIGKFIENFYVSVALIFLWLMLLNLEFFANKWVLITALACLVFFGLSSPFFYIIVFALWIIMLWHFVNATFSALDPKPEAK